MGEMFRVHIFGQRTEYFPGDWLDGVVLLRLTRSLTTRGVRLKIKGRERVEFKRGNTRYISKLRLFDGQLTLWGMPP